MFKDKVVIVTGGANGIGHCIADEFRAHGAHVYVIDKVEGDHFVGDIARQIIALWKATALPIILIELSSLRR